MDVVASLRPCAIEVQLGEWIYTIPELPAVDWIAAIVDPNGGAVVPGLMDEATQRDVWHCYLRGEIDPEELNQGWQAVIGAATGQDWWKPTRLFLAATDPSAWPTLHGDLVGRGVDLERVSVGAAYNVIYRIALEGCKDQQERMKLEFDLSQPPPGVSPADAFDRRGAAEDWMAAMSTLRAFDGGRTPA